MIKVGLFLDNEGIKDIDLSQPELGNPGIGGTQYNFITLPWYFDKCMGDKNIEFIYFCYYPEKINSKYETYKISSINEIPSKINDLAIDYLIWRPTNGIESIDFINLCELNKVNVIAWAHNTPRSNILNLLSKNEYVLRYVCVSQEQYDMVRDHPIIYKSITIKNGFDPLLYKSNEDLTSDNVVYVGSIIPAKGFHYLAECWPKIKKLYPKANLIVIGTGALYSRDSELGKWGVADESYEKKWRPFLSNDNGDIDSSVKFLGNLGNDKISIMKNACVGIANPTGKTENCPGVAIEFQAAGTPVVSSSEWGLLDTVIDQNTGFLGNKNNKTEFINNVVRLLKNKELARLMGKNGEAYVNVEFNHTFISNKWSHLFYSLENSYVVPIEPINQKPFYRFKIIKEMLRIFKGNSKILQCLVPPIFNIHDFGKTLRDKIIDFKKRNRSG